METELRFNESEFKIEDRSETSVPKIVGYAAVFNSMSSDLGGFREQILPGAFRDAIGEGREILALLHHDPSRPVGRRSAGTLSLVEDERGLLVEIQPGDTTVGRDALEMVRRRDIKGMSFRFRNAVSNWEKLGGERMRTITKIPEVLEVTLTAIPAYEATTAEVRSAIDELNQKEKAYSSLEAARRRLELCKRKQ